MSEDLTTDASGQAQHPSPPGYELLDEVGRGGMGVVYRARDVALSRDVAIKVLADRFRPDSAAAQRFLTEARITSQLQHPGIPSVHQVGALPDGRPFLAMKLIKGRTLETILKDRIDGAAERGQRLAVFETICQAVGYAHAHRVIHRDLKPANVMVGSFGEVQVMDWGLAKVLGEEAPAASASPATEQTRPWTEVSPTPEAGSQTQAGSLVGTPAFIPPEQAAGEIDKVDERADVFGLGALLVVILTGKPPYVGETAEALRVLAVRGKLDDCFARLDASGAEQELVALCRRCLAFEPADRPANAGEVAKAVGELRAAADDRARRAELDRVKAEGEITAAAARAAERRKRRRVWLGAAALLAAAIVGGLSAVVVVQQRANKDLSAEQAKVEARNRELADEQAKVHARFNMAVKAIETFHTGVSEETLLQNPQLEGLRTKLLRQAAGFYADLEKLLAGQTDAKSRKTLAAGYFQLAELTTTIGSRPEALAIHRKALAVRRELAATAGADVETRLDVARSLRAVGILLLRAAGDPAAALKAFEEQRDIAAALESETPTNAVRIVLAQSHNSIAVLLKEQGKPAESLETHLKALEVRQKLADANPGAVEFETELAISLTNIGNTLRAGQPEKALQYFERSVSLLQRLAYANPAVTQPQKLLAQVHNDIGSTYRTMERPKQALEAYQRGLTTWQKLVDTNPAVSDFNSYLATNYSNLGSVLTDMGQPIEGLAEYQKGLAIRQKLVETNPGVIQFQRELANDYSSVGHCLSVTGQSERALEPLRRALAIHQQRPDISLPSDRQRRLSGIHMAIGKVFSQLARPDEALEAYNNGLAIRRRQAEKSAAVFDQLSLGESHLRIGQLLARQGQFAEAFSALDTGVATCQKQVAADPKSANAASYLAFGHAYRGCARVRAGKPADAATDLRRAVELWGKDATVFPEARLEWARSLALLAGLGADAASGVTAAEAAGFASHAVNILRDASKTGTAPLTELKGPDFDALRNRDDFKKLVEELEAKG